MGAAAVTIVSLTVLTVGFLAGWLISGLGVGVNAVAFWALPVLVVGFLIGWVIEWIIDNQYRRIRDLDRTLAESLRAIPDSAEIASLVDSVQVVLGQREAEVERLRFELEQNETQMDHLRLELEQKKAQIADLRQKVGEKDSNLDLLKAEFDQVRAELAQKGSELVRLKSKYDMLRAELSQKEMYLGRLRGEFDQMRGGTQETESDLARLKAEFERYVATHPDDLTAIKGIGETYQDKLRRAGICTYAQLASANVELIREALETQNGHRVDPQQWIDRARMLALRG